MVDLCKELTEVDDFKVGDIVRRKPEFINYGTWFVEEVNGDLFGEYEIIGFTESGNNIFLKDVDYYFEKKYFEKVVNEPKKKYIVLLNGVDIKKRTLEEAKNEVMRSTYPEEAQIWEVVGDSISMKIKKEWSDEV